MQQLIDTNCLQDRNSGIDLLIQICDGNRANIGVINGDDLTMLGDNLETYVNYHYMLYLYTTSTETINMTDFKEKNIIDCMNSVITTAKYILFYDNRD